MAGKKKTTPPRVTTTTKLDTELARQAKVIAAYRGVELYDYLHDILRPIVVADFRKIVKGEKGGVVNWRGVWIGLALVPVGIFFCWLGGYVLRVYHVNL